MNNAGRCGALVVLLVFSTACGGSGPSSPIQPSQSSVVSSPAPPAPPPRTFPPPSGPSLTFVFDRELTHRVSDFTRNSRFVLFENGAFLLQYVGLGDSRGAYTESNGVITFEWAGSTGTGVGVPGATGTRNGDSLTVQYTINMQMADFEDAVYVLTR